MARGPVSAALCLVMITCVLPFAAASRSVAAPGSHHWGTHNVPYLNGLVCSHGAGSTALVSWPSPATSEPSYALGVVTEPDDPALAPSPDPAVAASTGTPATTADTGLSTAELAAFAYLLAGDGGSADPAVVAEVATLVARDPISEQCLAEQTAGRGAAAAQLLWQHALQQAGPYSVTLSAATTKLTLGVPTTVVAHVLSAAGVPASGVQVTFAAGDAVLSPTPVMTDSAGDARTTLRVPGSFPAAAITVTASVSVSVGLIEMTYPGAVPLVAPAAPVQQTGQDVVPVDTTADPAVAVRPRHTLVLPKTTVRNQVAITGMRGHEGTAVLTVLGPLPFVASTGCTGYDAARWRAARLTADAAPRTVVPGQVQISGDGVYATAPVLFAEAGCYALSVRVSTSNAVPNVVRISRDGDAAGLVSVAPLHVSAAPVGHGVASVGTIATTLRVEGDTPATLDAARGALLGPRPASFGRCPASGWANSPSASALTPRDDAPAGAAVVLSSAPVRRTECYAFAITATLNLRSLGDIAITMPPSAATGTALVLDPSVSVTDLSSSHVVAGGRIRATVSVNGTLTQPGRIRLQLAYLPYTYRGCYGLDWSHANLVALGADAPSTASSGDSINVVTSPPVPAAGCWTVQPVLTLTANPAVRVVGRPGASWMFAFTALQPQGPPPRADVGAGPASSALQLVLTALLAFALIGSAVAMTLVIARRTNTDALA